MKLRQKKLRLLAIMLALVMTFSNIIVVKAADGEDEVDQMVKAQERAIEANEILMQYFLLKEKELCTPITLEDAILKIIFFI